MRQYRGIPIDEAKDSGKFLFGGFYERSGKSYIIRSDATFLHQFLPIKYARFIEVHPATVGQFLHSQDHNGQDEYEGDIVKTDTGVTGVLKLSLQNFHRYEDWDEETKDLYDKKKFPYNYCEIIGTIHDKEQTP